MGNYQKFEIIGMAHMNFVVCSLLYIFFLLTLTYENCELYLCPWLVPFHVQYH